MGEVKMLGGEEFNDDVNAAALYSKRALVAVQIDC